MALSDYYVNIDIIQKETTSDDLGGYVVTYKKIGTIKGLLQRSSTAERTIAAQTGVSNVYTLITNESGSIVDSIKSDVIVRSSSITAIVTSDVLVGQGDMKDISQWQCETYALPEGTNV